MMSYFSSSKYNYFIKDICDNCDVVEEHVRSMLDAEIEAMMSRSTILKKEDAISSAIANCCDWINEQPRLKAEDVGSSIIATHRRQYIYFNLIKRKGK